MESRPPEVTDSANGESLKLACMSCIRGHRTKHCGAQVCRDKIFWTIKRPGRPSNSCMCKFSGTGRCKCVLAKAQCPHKPKRGEKRVADCRCDERGRLCCTLPPAAWDMIAKGERPRVRLHRTLEELYAGIPHAPGSIGNGALPQGQSPMSTPQTPAASVGGFTSGSGGSTPQTPMSVLHTSIGSAQAASLPQSPAGPPRTRFGMMGFGAPMGSEGHIGQDVLSWQGQTPVAPAPRQTYGPPLPYSQPPYHIPPAFPAPADNSFAASPYTFDSSISQPPSFSPQQPQAHIHSHPQTPLYQPQIPQHHTQHTFDHVPPVTESLNELTVTPHVTLPGLTGFDMDYFNFQFPGAICQQCGMADCTCRSCPTVLQNTLDGSWQQCCSRKHVHFGAASTAQQASQAVKKSCCGSKASAGTPAAVQSTQQPPPLPAAANGQAYAFDTRNAGGCCSGSNSQADFSLDTFDFNTQSELNHHQTNLFPSNTPTPAAPYIPAFNTPEPANGLVYDPGAPLRQTKSYTQAPTSIPQHDPFPSEAPTPAAPYMPAFTTPEPANGLLYDPGAPLPQSNTHSHAPTPMPHRDPFTSTVDPNPELDFKQDPIPNWADPDDIDMDFDEFIQENGCGCGADCPCGMDDGAGGLVEDLDDSFEMEVDHGDPGGGVGGEAGVAVGKLGGCCGS